MLASGINRRDSVSVLSMRLDAHGSGIDIDDFDGRIVVSDVRYDYPEGEIIADRIVLDSRNDADSKYTKLSSPFVDATLVSKTSYRSIAQYLANSLHRYIPLLYDERSMRDEGGTGQQIVADDFSIVDINIKNINPIMSAVDRGWQIAEGSSVQLLFNPRSNSLTVQARADYIERDMMLATNLRLNANNRSDSLAMYLSAEDLYIGALHMPNLSVTGGAEANRVRLTAGFRDAAERVSGMIGMHADFARDGETGARMVHVGITPSHVSTRDKTWKIFSRGIDISQGRIVVGDLRVVEGGGQMIMFNRAVDSLPADKAQCLDRIVGGNVVDVVIDDPLQVFGLVDGPDIDRESELVSLVDPLRVLLQYVEFVVESGIACGMEILGFQRAVKVGHLGACRCQTYQLVAYMLAESDILYAILQLVALDRIEDHLDDLSLYLRRIVVLDLDDELAVIVLGRLVEILVQCRYDLSVLQLLRTQRSQVALLNIETVGVVLLAEPRTVDNDELAVGCKVDIALRAVYAQLLCVFECCQRVACRTLLGMITAVCYYLRLSLQRHHRQECGGDSDDFFHSKTVNSNSVGQIYA